MYVRRVGMGGMVHGAVFQVNLGGMQGCSGGMLPVVYALSVMEACGAGVGRAPRAAAQRQHGMAGARSHPRPCHVEDGVLVRLPLRGGLDGAGALVVGVGGQLGSGVDDGDVALLVPNGQELATIQDLHRFFIRPQSEVWQGRAGQGRAGIPGVGKGRAGARRAGERQGQRWRRSPPCCTGPRKRGWACPGGRS